MGLLISDIGQKWCSEKWRTVILKLPKSKLLVQNTSNMAQNDPKDDHPKDFPWDHFEPYLMYFGPVVWILEPLIYSSTIFWSTIFGRYPILTDPYCKILKKKWSEEIMYQLEYLFGIILSHVWDILDQQFGFWKLQYNRPPLLGAPFLANIKS